MSSVANRIQKILDENELDLNWRGSDEGEIRDIAFALDIELDFSGSDDGLCDRLESAIEELEG